MRLSKFTDLSRGLAIVLLAVAPSIAVANKSMNVCVQAQLAISGFSPGVIDGRIGPDTKVAAKNLLDTAPVLADLPELSSETSYDWCRALGKVDERLKGFWPAKIESQTWLSEPIKDSAAKETLDGALDAVGRYFAKTYGRELVGGFAFLAGESPGELESEAERRRRAAGKNWTALFPVDGMPCPERIKLSTVGFRDMLLLCWGKTAQYDSAWQTQYTTILTSTFAREYVHALQSDLSRLDSRQTLPSGEYAVGPQWLSLGSSIMFESEFKGAELPLEDLHMQLSGVQVPLRDLHERVDQGAPLDTARLAAHLLGARYGRQSLFDFYDNLRSAESWDSAFQSTFDLPLTEFETRFEVLREDLSEAMRFSQGQ